jgi:predicted lipoprotein with Yx(FWY)xxD motif
MVTRTNGSRFGLIGRATAARLAGALLLATLTVPALSIAAGAAGCGACDDDGDGLTNADELTVYGTDLQNPDSDGDGVYDGYEVSMGLSPLSADSDGDGLGDYEELNQDDGSDPGSGDADADGLSDGYEGQVSLTDPYTADTDRDGLSDGKEINVTGTDPLRADSDNDGMLDSCDHNPWVFDAGDGAPNGGLVGERLGCSSIS